ncbi:hypothetical protein [Gordonia sp. CPCC 205333]|uniref:hypothetical protein n=1 Tax=Gordonia sp. CPCC 205333 TaxID=3140790 RepID=UPI003AF3A72E
MNAGTPYYAERKRRDEAARLSTPISAEDILEEDERLGVKLATLWETVGQHYDRHAFPGTSPLSELVRGVLKMHTGIVVYGGTMASAISGDYDAETKLSIIEATAEILSREVRAGQGSTITGSEMGAVFTRKVNKVFQDHNVNLELDESRRFIPIESPVVHSNVVMPAPTLMRGDTRFAGVEKAYEDALTELRRGEGGNAVTDAGTALQEAFEAVGIAGGTLGKQIDGARNSGVLGGTNSPFAESLVKVAQWVAAKRNNGEAHRAVHGIELNDAWFIVHVVGAFIVYLHQTTSPTDSDDG